ncbi:LysR family transcriptional regulator [Variovorax sp. RO1]|uniref:LysR family transcriptional regulator n=1 Tax=Variovorax sp. RO1 TaxID=2066034 RepID=UPI000C717A1A|nr:LysR family transcriptional regulator [Variovorax sp. RO1]PLC03191.1 LysR family transcriptional regulator [Variovorax sp. RO1]
MDRLTAMCVFRKVVERGSFTVAAEQMRMSNASVSKYVAALENHIGTPLLARTTRRINLTDAGRSYYDKCVRILDDVEEAEKSAGQLQTTPRGLLKVRAPVSLGTAHLGRTVADFLAGFPEVTIDMTLNDRFVDPAEEGVDVALFIADHVKDPTGATRAIAKMPRMLVAAPAYLAARGAPETLADLVRHNCLVYTRGQTPDEWRFTEAGSERMVRVGGNCRCNNSLVLREALLAGAGIGLLPAFLVTGHLADGNLHTVLPGVVPEPRTLFAVFPQPRRPSPKVREFVNFVARSFAADSQWQLEAEDATAVA